MGLVNAFYPCLIKMSVSDINVFVDVLDSLLLLENEKLYLQIIQ